MMQKILAFTLGILLIQQGKDLPDLSLLLAGIIGLFLIEVWQRAKGMDLGIGFMRRLCRLSRVALVPILAIFIGMAWATWRAELRLADQLSPDWEGQDIRVQGYIASLPQVVNAGYRFVWRTTTVLTPAAQSAKLPEQVLLTWYPGKHRVELAAGSAWEITVRLKRPHGGANPHGFDYAAWLFERNLRATGYVREGTIQAISPAIIPLAAKPGLLLEQWRGALRQGFWQALPERDYPYVGILIALVIGEQSAIDGELWPLFSKTGVTHLLSVSGLHVTLVSSLFAYVVTCLWRRFPYLVLKIPVPIMSTLLAAVAALVYSLLAGFAVPAQRTLYMLLVAAAARLTHRHSSSGQILTYALGVVLLLDPWAVLAPGFWLSFGGVAALLYVSQGQQSMPTSQAASARFSQLWQRIREWSMSQWAVTLASLPILLLVFQQFSLVSPLANAVAIPVISLLVTPLALVAALLPWPPLLYFLHWVLAYLLGFLTWCSTWPLWYAAAPPLWAAIAAAGGVILLLLPHRLPLHPLGCLFVLPLAFWQPSRPAPGEFTLTVLDVGQGLASVIETATQTLVFDTGPQYRGDSDAGQRVLLPFLRARGITQLQHLIVSHDDNDHAGGVLAVQGALPIQHLYLSRPVHGVAATTCTDGMTWEADGVSFRFLHPHPEDVAAGLSDINLSCVLVVQSPHGRVVLTADIESEAEQRLLQRYPSLPVTALVVPHHGSRSSSTPSFVQALHPAIAIISAGYRNRFGHPKHSILARYAHAGSQLWRTDEDGAITLTISAQGVKVTAAREQGRRYWAN